MIKSVIADRGEASAVELCRLKLTPRAKNPEIKVSSIRTLRTLWSRRRESRLRSKGSLFFLGRRASAIRQHSVQVSVIVLRKSGRITQHLRRNGHQKLKTAGEFSRQGNMDIRHGIRRRKLGFFRRATAC